MMLVCEGGIPKINQLDVGASRPEVRMTSGIVPSGSFPELLAGKVAGDARTFLHEEDVLGLQIRVRELKTIMQKLQGL
eukprot:Skav207783  [mRNA]  locus=scaffold70:91296:93236:- [translate_table: standard]